VATPLYRSATARTPDDRFGSIPRFDRTRADGRFRR